jgi:hypothetical protein
LLWDTYHLWGYPGIHLSGLESDLDGLLLDGIEGILERLASTRVCLDEQIDTILCVTSLLNCIGFKVSGWKLTTRLVGVLIGGLTRFSNPVPAV